jgi:hypothetical protein
MKCTHTKLDGTQCGANAMKESEFCFSHNPKVQKEKELAVTKGGRAPKPRKDAESLPSMPLRTADDIAALIQDTINRVRTEPMTHQKANCIGYLAGIALKAFEVGRLDEQVQLIQNVLGLRK